MGESKKTSDSSFSQTTTPYGASQGAIDKILSGSLGAYNSGAGSGVYTGPRVADFSSASQAGQDYLAQNASAGLGAAQGGNDFLTRLLGQGGATAATSAATNNLLGVGTASTSGITNAVNQLADPNSAAANAGRVLTSGAYNLNGAGYDALNSGLAGPSQTQTSLQDAASGKYLAQGGNPYLESQISTSNADALNSVKNAFSASGRYGSGMFSNAAADAISRNENNLRYADYSAERDRQAQAAQAIDAQTLARTQARQGLYGASNDVRTANAGQLVQGAGLATQAAQNALTGQQAAFNADTTNNQQQISQFLAALQGAQGDRAAAQSGLGQVAGVQSSLAQPGKTLIGVGGLQDTQQQARLDAAQQQFADQQAAPWKALGLLTGTTLPIAQGFASRSGTGQNTETTDPGLLNSVIGGASGALGLATKAGQAAPAISSFLSLLSDERAKEDIERVGKLDDGQPIYRFRYVGDPTVHVGLIAQDVRERYPEAVTELPSGLLAVDYGKATEAAARGAR